MTTPSFHLFRPKIWKWSSVLFFLAHSNSCPSGNTVGFALKIEKYKSAFSFLPHHHCYHSALSYSIYLLPILLNSFVTFLPASTFVPIQSVFDAVEKSVILSKQPKSYHSSPKPVIISHFIHCKNQRYFVICLLPSQPYLLPHSFNSLCSSSTDSLGFVNMQAHTLLFQPFVLAVSAGWNALFSPNMLLSNSLTSSEFLQMLLLNETCSLLPHYITATCPTICAPHCQSPYPAPFLFFLSTCHL